MLVALYLTAIVSANLLVAHFGPALSIITAAVFIGLDLSTRDALHEKWRGQLWLRMGALITVGSFVSWAVNRDAGKIALASMIAFGAAATVDAVLYHFLRKRPWLQKSNGSNVLAAAVDSLVFPTIAFGGFLPAIVLGQFAAKVGGGFVWSLILNYYRKDEGAAPSNPRSQDAYAV